MKDLSILIVNYNTSDLLKNCLESVYVTIRGLSFEVIVVDNASLDGSIQMLKENYPDVKVVRNDSNLGFGAANNQAINEMRGRYALLLNTDTVLKPGAVRELFNFMESHPEAAMACGQLLNADGSKQNSIASFPSFLTLSSNMGLLEYMFPRRYPSKRYSHANPVEIDSGIGACLLIRKRALDEVGKFDTRYFFFFEETDLAMQMKKCSWKIFHVPTAYIVHLQGQSIGHSADSRIEFYRSRYQFLRKWNSRPSFMMLTGVIVLRLVMNWALTVAGVVFSFGHKGLSRRLVVYSRLISWHLKGCPR